jgi:OmpA-OmpF porin, OOP family
MTPRQIQIAVAAGILVLLIAVLYVAGVGSDTGTRQDGETSVADKLTSAGVVRSACPRPTGAAPAEPAGVTAVLLDRSASVRGRDAPAYATAVEAALRETVLRGDAVVVSGFDGTSATVRWTLVNTAFRGDERRVLLARDDALRCLMEEAERAAEGTAEEPDTDVLGALQAAEDPIGTAPAGQRRLLVATDGIVTTGCADLNGVAIGGTVEPVVAACRAAEQLPELTGTDVAMLGVGSPGPGQPRPKSKHVKWLAELWTQLCIASTSTAEDCTVTNTGVATTANETPPGSAADQQVRWPEIEQTTVGRRLILTLSDGLLFDTDSSVLRPDAREALSAVAAKVREVAGTVVEVVGHTDGRGEPAYNDALSLGRAQAVAEGLRTEYGLVIEHPERGAGENEPKCTPEVRPDGNLDRAAQQCNRRVEVVIRLPEGSR